MPTHDTSHTTDTLHSEGAPASDAATTPAVTPAVFAQDDAASPAAMPEAWQHTTFSFSYDEGVQLLLTEEQMREICLYVLHDQQVSRPCTISISIVTIDHIHDINREFRGQDKPTDVISIECERPDDPSLAAGEPCELGDIILASEYIAHQADDFGMDHQDECRLLLIHAMLHLLGYDHLCDADAEVMEALEDRLLIEVGTTKHVGHVTLTRHRDEQR